MFTLYANKTRLLVRTWEPITSGSKSVYTLHFDFSPDWDDFRKYVSFYTEPVDSDKKVKTVELPVTNEVEIPWEVLVKPKVNLMVGVYGKKSVDDEDGVAILPTVWAKLATIFPGAIVTEGSGGTVTPGPSSGTMDHRELTHRDAENQHPITSIDGLKQELMKIPLPVEPLTNADLDALLS